MIYAYCLCGYKCRQCALRGRLNRINRALSFLDSGHKEVDLDLGIVNISAGQICALAYIQFKLMKF